MNYRQKHPLFLNLCEDLDNLFCRCKVCLSAHKHASYITHQDEYNKTHGTENSIGRLSDALMKEMV